MSILSHSNDNFEEQDTLRLQELLQEISGGIPVPESISPDNMKKKLHAPQRQFPIQKYIAAAACLVLVLGCVVTVSLFAGMHLGMAKSSGQNMTGGASSSSCAAVASDMMPESLEAENNLSARELTDMQAASYDDVAKALAPIAQRNVTLGQGIIYDENGNKVNPPTAGGGPQPGTGGQESSPAAGENTVDSSQKYNPGTAGTNDTGDQTNNQVDGVVEADIVKTDGNYIYYSNSDTVNIVKMEENGGMEQVSTIKDKEFCYTLDMFLEGSNLVVLSSSNTSLDRQRKMLSDSADTVQSTVKATFYDVSDPAVPAVERVITQDGDYQDARMIDGMLYLVSQQYLPLEKTVDQLQPADYVPAVTDSTQASGALLSADSIYLLPTVESACYNIVSAVNVREPGGAVNTRAILGSSSQMYVSTNSMYLVCDTFDDAAQISYSNVYKLELSGLNIVMTASGRVKGSILNQFSMDEYDGYFRIATNLFDGRKDRRSNNLYVLDENLELVSYLENMAQGEELKSVRFMGESAYLVTFKQVDPLFAVDLSDPAKPQILGELKIPGFSSYLHPVSENLLVGVGYDTKEVNDGYGSTFTVTGGIKLSLFDVSDKADPKEVTSVVLGDCGSYSELMNDHKAFLFYEEKGLIGIPVTLTKNATPGRGYYESRYENSFNGYVLFQVTGSKLEEAGRITHQSEEAQKNLEQEMDSALTIHRGVYKGDYIYTLSDLKAKSTSLSDGKDVKEIALA
ncbi:beta-propeller domain-containing protein [Zongyangia hominis]|uniref:Beta-propeller domain-containing protein n=1 Tax=Zongyangia hominis TaxID=2763677 RepID=A0A926E8T0_9FIRM|nr:beta-propeller domain-containing protein [Zongyangia hominis]MBC8569422.1 beta-propeller domain-containing protein [Zongyangia hominis]